MTQKIIINSLDYTRTISEIGSLRPETSKALCALVGSHINHITPPPYSNDDTSMFKSLREEVAVVEIDGVEYSIIADGVKMRLMETLKSDFEGSKRLEVFLMNNPKIEEALKMNSISIKAKPFAGSFYYEMIHGPTGATERVMGSPVIMPEESINDETSGYMTNITNNDRSVSTLFNITDGVGSRLSDLIRPLGLIPIGAKSDGSDALFRDFEKKGVHELLKGNDADMDFQKIGMDLLSTLTGVRKTGIFVDGALVQEGKMGLCLIHTAETMGEYVLAFGDEVMEILPLGAMNFIGSISIKGFQVLARPDILSR